MLSELYVRLEEKYYKLLDILDSKGIPVYKYDEFCRKIGIPSMIMSFFILLLLISVPVLFMFLPQEYVVKVIVKAEDRSQTFNYTLFLVDKGKEIPIAQGKVRSIVEKRISLRPSKDAKIKLKLTNLEYLPYEKTVPLEKEVVFMVRPKFNAPIFFKVKAVDGETNVELQEVKGYVELDGKKIEGKLEDGYLLFGDIPKDKRVKIHLEAPGYEVVEDFVNVSPEKEILLRMCCKLLKTSIFNI